MMLYNDVILDSPENNIRYDEVLLQLAEESTFGETLRIWESPVYCVVLGKTSSYEDDIYLKAVSADGIPVIRRASGGGTVVLGPGCLNYSLVLNKHFDPALNSIKGSYKWILNKIISALCQCGVDASFCGYSDIAIRGNTKISGNAQKRGRRYILHHGTLLYAFDIEKIERYLAIPAHIPDYRRDREHRSFVVNSSLPRQKFIDALRNIFSATKQDPEVEKIIHSRLRQDYSIPIKENHTKISAVV